MTHPLLPLRWAPDEPLEPTIDPDRSWRLAIVGDIHGNLPAVDRVIQTIKRASYDATDLYAVLLVGDFTGLDSRHPSLYGAASAEACDIIARFRRELPCPVLAVPGNHDAPRIPDEGNIDGRWARLRPGGLVVSGLGGGGPARFGWPYEWDEHDMHAYIRRAFPNGIPEGVILSHTPPKGILDQSVHGDLCGSALLTGIAEQHRGLFVCGHIHEARGVKRINQCTVINAGSLGQPYPWYGITLAVGAGNMWVVDQIPCEEYE